MNRVELVLGEFVAAWQAGERPRVEAHLERVADSERDALAAQLGAWLEMAPTPAFDRGALAAIDAEPALRAALAAARAPLPARMRALRERAGLALPDVGRRLVALFGVDDAPRAARYLDRAERAELDPGRLSARLLDALAAILGADPDQLAPVPAAPGRALFRADADAEGEMARDLDALSRAALAPAPAPMDELDRLFLGGPDG